jgi:hypothetical protein
LASSYFPRSFNRAARLFSEVAIFGLFSPNTVYLIFSDRSYNGLASFIIQQKGQIVQRD